jgi:hypothetical protein
MLIDYFLPRFDMRSHYYIDVKAPAERAYLEARRLDMRDSFIIRLLYRLRGLPDSDFTFEEMLRQGFVLLADDPPREIVFGLIGRFWRLSPLIEHIRADDFVRFGRPGFAKIVGNLAFTPLGRNRGVRVWTETRVQSLCASSRRSFRIYWLIIAPFSGLIRKEWLRLIKRKAENPSRARLPRDSSPTIGRIP